MLNYLRKPHTDLGTLILRLGLGFVFAAQGYFKVVDTKPLSEHMSLTEQQILGWTEMSCGILLLVGLLSRLASLMLIADMIGAIVLVTGRRGFFDTSLGAHGFQFKAGSQYNFMIIVASLALLVLGSGWFSLDHLIFDRKRRPAAPVPPAPALAPTPAGARLP